MRRRRGSDVHQRITNTSRDKLCSFSLTECICKRDCECVDQEQEEQHRYQYHGGNELFAISAGSHEPDDRVERNGDVASCECGPEAPCRRGR